MSQRFPPPSSDPGGNEPSELPGWTDYLRTGIPLVGVLCLIGLFWFWTDSLIGNGSSAEGEPTAIAATTQDAPVVPTATGPAQVIDVGQTPTVPPTAPAAAAQPTATSPAAVPEDTPTPTAPAQENLSLYAVGDTVVVGTDDLRLRDAPSIDGAVVSTLSRGTVLEVIGPGQEADDYIWVEVKDPASDATGFVADKFLESSS